MPEDNPEQNPQPDQSGGLVPARLIRNPISLIGLALAVVGFANIVFLFLLDTISRSPSPYIGILAYTASTDVNADELSL